jgi:glutathione S-transferase
VAAAVLLQRAARHVTRLFHPVDQARQAVLRQQNFAFQLKGSQLAAGALEFKQNVVPGKRRQLGDAERSLDGGQRLPLRDGERFSLVDVVFGPVFRYFDAFDRIGDFGILAGKPKLAAYRDALAARPSVRNAVSPDNDIRLWKSLQARNSHFSRLIADREKPISAEATGAQTAAA